MLLKRLHVTEYKVLKDFELDFDETHSLTALIGPNGSGKSTLLEVIIIIFSKLFRLKNIREISRLKFPFEFEFSYLLKRDDEIKTRFDDRIYKNYVGIKLSFKESFSIQIYFEDRVYKSINEIESFLREYSKEYNYILPEKLVIYYAGIAKVLYNDYKDFIEDYITASFDGENIVNTPYYYFQSENFPSILIGLLSYKFGNVPKLLKDKFGIDGFSSINIEMKKPSWAKEKISSVNFWGARGDLKTFLNLLKNSASSSSFHELRIYFEFSDQESLQKIWEFYGSEKNLFEYLVTIQENGLIGSISIDIIKNDIVMSFQRLSEGEKQLLIILGLKELVAADNSLFLLDEPDTYLHPEWQRSLIDEITNDWELYKNYFIITSHSPNIVSGLRKEQLNIISKGKLKYYSFKPYGKPINEILIDFFSVSGLRTKKIEQKFEELKTMIKNDTYDSDEYKELIQVLKNELGPDAELMSILLEVKKREYEKNK